MQFLNPLFLLGSLAVVGPILLHMIRNEESQRILFSSLMFVTRIPKKSLRRQKLRHLLLLALRIAILLTLVLAFSRPFFTFFNVARGRPASSKCAILLLDNSFSMKWGNRFSEAQRQAISVLNGLSNQDQVQILSFSDSAQVLSPLQHPNTSLKTLVLSLRPSDRKTNYLQALKLVRQLLASSDSNAKEIHLISDFQESGWPQSQSDLPMELNARIIPHLPATSRFSNVWIQQVQIKERNNLEGPEAVVSATVAGTGLQFPFRTTVQLEINGKKVQERAVTLDSEHHGAVEFSPFAEPSGVSRGIVRITDLDLLPADNTSYFCLNPNQKLKVLLLVSDRHSASQRHLLKALTASTDSPFEVDIQDIRSAGGDLSSYSAVLVHCPDRMPRPVAVSLRGFLKLGGGMVLDLGPETPARELNEQLGDILPAQLKVALSGGSLHGTMYPRELIENHPIFSIFQGVHRTYFLTTPVYGYVPVEPKPAARVLARLENGGPLLLEGKAGKGKVLLMTSSLSLVWNQFPLRSIFLPFCQQVIKYAADWDKEPHAYEVGDTIPLTRFNAHLARTLNRIIGTDGSFRQSWKIVPPSGEVIVLSDSDLVRSPAVTLEEEGFYQTRIHNFTQYLAANVDPAESNLKPMNPQRLLESIQSSPESREHVSQQDPEVSSISREQRQRFWRYLAGVALFLLLFESLVSNRFYRLKTET